MSTRREFLGAAAGAALAPRLVSAADGAAIHFPFDRDLRNEGEWGGAIRAFGPTAAEPLVAVRGGIGVADLTSDWFQVQGGRLLYETPNLRSLESFSVALAFQPLRSGSLCTLLMRLFQWRIYLSTSGFLTVQVYYSPAAAQSLTVGAVRQPGVWYQLALSADRSAGKLYFVFQREGADSPISAGAFQLLADALGPATDRSRQILDIGGNVSGEKLYGYLDNIVLWPRALPEADLRRILADYPPSLREVGLPAAPDLVFIVPRDKEVALPSRSDVCMSSRWWHPRDRTDPHDTLRDLVAFRATRLEWIYDTTASRIQAVKERGLRWISTINGNDAAAGRPLSIRDFDGNFAVYPHMITWKQADGLPPGAGCVNNPGVQKQQFATVEAALANGADGIQYDDWGSNVYVTGVIGDCLCEHCVAKFRAYLASHHRAEELAAWGVASVDDFNYRVFLTQQRGVKSQADYMAFVRKSPPDPLRSAYYRFQISSVRDLLGALQKELKARRTRDGMKPTLAVNAGLLSPSQQSIQGAAADLPDYAVFEGTDESVAGLFMYSKASEALGKISVLSPFPFEVDTARSTIALRYALGQLCLVPYDIWMYTSDVPRYFGAPADYVDLFEFVRAHADLFEGYETVAAVAIAGDAATAQDSRLRPLVERLAYENVPFALAPLGGDHYAAPLDAEWCERLPFVIDLSGRTEVRARFPNARFLRAELTAEDLRRLTVLEVEAPHVLAVVRARGAGGERSAVIHLVNRNFDEAGRVMPLEHFGIRLLQQEFWGKVNRIEWLAPGSKVEALGFQRWGYGLRVSVPRLGAWAVLKIQEA